MCWTFCETLLIPSCITGCNICSFNKRWCSVLLTQVITADTQHTVPQVETGTGTIHTSCRRWHNTPACRSAGPVYYGYCIKTWHPFIPIKVVQWHVVFGVFCVFYCTCRWWDQWQFSSSSFIMLSFPVKLLNVSSDQSLLIEAFVLWFRWNDTETWQEQFIMSWRSTEIGAVVLCWWLMHHTSVAVRPWREAERRLQFCWFVLQIDKKKRGWELEKQ